MVSSYPITSMFDDFQREKLSQSEPAWKKQRMGQNDSSQQDQEREYLKPYETLPAQLLNVYGPGKWASMDDKALWYDINQKLPTGAKCMSEL